MWGCEVGSVHVECEVGSVCMWGVRHQLRRFYHVTLSPLPS